MRAVVIDFDGTLYRGNSFEDCVLMTMKRAFGQGHWLCALRIVFWIALRKLRLISHARLKYHLQPILEKHYDSKAFLLHLRLHLNEELWEECRQYRELGYHLCLATAACDFYIKDIAEDLQFDSYCATPSSNQSYAQWKENRGEVKRDSCLRLLAAAGAELELVITDHPDDQALIDIAPYHLLIKNQA